MTFIQKITIAVLVSIIISLSVEITHASKPVNTETREYQGKVVYLGVQESDKPMDLKPVKPKEDTIVNVGLIGIIILALLL